MELDDLKALWKETDRRLEAMEPALRLNLRLAQAGALDRTRSKLRFVSVVLWYEAGVSALAALLVAFYLVDHVGTVRFALPATALQLAAILTLGYAARQLVSLHQIDYSGPVLSIQRGLAEFRVVRARWNRALMFSAQLLWTLLIVVVPHGLFGFDIYRAFGLPWVAANLVFGLAVVGAAVWVSRRFPAASRSSALLRWLGDDLTGRRVAEASAFLDDIAGFANAEG